ncbi:hypothetical protein IIA16_06510, partial [bacterium]|nr:hypothetical protein [bacterium]
MMELLYEGKAKVLYDDGVPGTLVQRFKDDATADNAAKRGQFAGKGFLNRAISQILMAKVEAAGVPTHFVANIDETRDRVRRVEIIMLEVVMRNVAAGSFCRRFAADGRMAGDVLTLDGDAHDGAPLMAPVMRAGRRLAAPATLAGARAHAREE